VNLTAVLPSIADDVVQNYWAEKYIVAVGLPLYGYKLDTTIMNNYSDSTFRADVQPKRDVLAVYLIRAARLAPCCVGNVTTDCSICKNRTFNDVSADNWAWPYIDAMVEHGYMSGYAVDNTFRPSETFKISVLKKVLFNMGIANAYPPGLQEHYTNEHKITLTDDFIVTREMMAAFLAYNLKLPGESDYPSVYLQWLFPIDPNAGFDFGYEIWRFDPGATDWSLLYVQDPPEQGMEVGSDLGMFYDKSVAGGKTYSYNVYLFNRDGDYSAPATVSISVP